MARLVKATCPQCGAGVQIDPAHDWVTCSYCGTSSFINKDATQVRPQHSPPQPYSVIDLATATAKTQRSVWSWALVPVFLTVLAGAIPVVIQLVKASDAGSAIGLIADAFNTIRVADAAMLGDANGDGVADPLVAFWSNSGNDTVKQVAALDANTGKVLWTSDAIAKSGDSAKLAAAGGVLLSTEVAQLDGYDLRSGKRLWEKSLPERVNRFCDDGHNGVGILTSDDRVYGLEPLSGALNLKGQLRKEGETPERRQNLANLSPASRKDAERRIQDWERERAAEFPCVSASSPDSSHGIGVSSHRNTTLHIDGLSRNDLDVWQERDREPRLVVGEKTPGSRIPMIAAISADSKPIWKAELPSKDPLGANEGSPAAFTLNAGRVVVGYYRSAENQFVVSAWALATGQRYWEIFIPAKAAHWFGIAINDRHVFVRIESRLSAFALADGRPLWTFGQSQ